MLDKNRAQAVIDFMQMLKLTDDFVGKPFVVQPWMQEIITNVYGTVTEKGLRQYNYAYLEIPKKNSKALALDTRIPTPNGWRAMGDLEVGDYVFGDDGKPTKILHTSETFYGNKCFEVVFENGEKIIADAGHLWETSTYKPWLKTSVKTTEDIEGSLDYQNGHNHKIKVCKPLEYASKELLVKPYTLGVWLGDGESRGARITKAKRDLEIMHQVSLDGYPTKLNAYRDRAGGFSISDGVLNRTKSCFHKDIKKLGLYGNKHIPRVYLESSVDQRYELLKGLMDTDGTVSKSGQCSFSSSRKELADGVLELIQSLGFKASIRVEKLSEVNPNHSDSYQIQFWAYKDTPVFKLGRKLERQKKTPKSPTRTKFRKIIGISGVESVPVKCIAVDNESNLYLVNEGFIPTHNTTTIAGLGVSHLVNDDADGQIFCCAADRAQAGLVYKAAVSMINQAPELATFLKITDSKKEIKNKLTGTVLKVLSAESYTKHGLNPTVVIFDELHAQPNRELWDVMTFGAGAARREPLWWIITTAGFDPDRLSIGFEIHEYARKIIEGEVVDPSWYAKIFCAPDDADIYDEDTWALANPSLGVTISIDAVRKEAILAKNSPAAERLFRWLRLNQWVSLKKLGWLELTLWDNTVGNWNTADLIGKKCYAGLDLASTTDLTGLALLFPPQQGLYEWRFLLEAWIPDAKMKERIARDHVPYDKWVAEKFLHVTAGETCDYDFVRARIETVDQQYDIKFLCTDPWNSRMLTSQLAKTGMEIIEVSQSIAGMSPGMKEIERLLKAGLMTHERNPLGRWCFGNVIIATDGNENIKPMKNKSRDRIDPIVALINAMSIAITQETARPNILETIGARSL